MKRFLIAGVAWLLASVAAHAAATANFPNINVRTNAQVGGTNFVKDSVITNAFTLQSATASMVLKTDGSKVAVSVVTTGAITGTGSHAGAADLNSSSFDPTYFLTNSAAPQVSLLGNLTNWAKLATNSALAIPFSPTLVHGLWAWYDPGETATVTLNGTGVSELKDIYGTNHLYQATAANQPLISRADNKGNLLKQSEAFNTTWVRSAINAFGATDTGAAGAGSFANTARTTDPLGGNTADFLQEDSATSAHQVTQQPTIGSGTYTYSVFAKEAGRSWIVVEPGGTAFAYFDIHNGATGTVTSATATISSIGSGWYLCSVTASITAGATTFYVQTATGNNGHIYAGDNTSGIYVWGAALHLSSYVPVTGPTEALGYVATTSLPIYAGLNGRSVMNFDGVAHYLKSATNTLNQPTTIVGVFKNRIWTASRTFFDGYATGTGKLYQHTADPKIGLYAGADAGDNSNLTNNTWSVISAIFNNSFSSLQVNTNTAVTGAAGTGNMSGFTLGADGANSNFGSIGAGPIFIYNRNLLPDEISYLVGGLKSQCGLTF